MLRGGSREGVGGTTVSAALRELPQQRLCAEQTLEVLCTFCLFFPERKMFFGFLSLTKTDNNMGLS